MSKSASIPIIGSFSNLAGHARPSAALRRKLGSLGTQQGFTFMEKMDAIYENAVAVDALARLLQEKIEKNQTKDGRVDMRDVASEILEEMTRHQR